MIDRLNLKNRAARIISEAIPSPTTVTIVFLVLVAVIDFLIGKLSEPLYFWEYDISFNGIVPHFERSFFPPALLIFALNIMLQIVTVGYLSCTLKISRKQPFQVSDLGDGFYRCWTIIGIYILQTVFIMLWSLLFIIPGIIAAYRYRLAYYIALDRTDLGPLQCINESKRLMYGYKTELFILDVSFLGWWLLGVLTFGILLIWKLPYIQVTYAYFYQQLLLIHANRPGGPEPPFML
jgi:uncharacterized membrane protein